MASVGDDEDSFRIGNETEKNDFAVILGRLRSQLLDLTARNRLVNFRYTRRSLRFVGIGLDVSYKSLLAGKSLQLQYVPLPSDEEVDKHPPARDYAVQFGLPTSYELEYSDVSTDYLQTLLYPKDLDRITRVMREENRLATDEGGSHILFLVSGFLQYTLSQGASASKHVAPLLLLPVQFVRGEVDPVSGFYTYYLKALEEEEEVRDNITLREKLNHELGFQLPIYKEQHSPSSYLQEISDACANQKGWQVLSHLSLVLLSFKKIALWADLDMQKDQILVNHPLMQKLFGLEKDGASNEGVAGDRDTEEYSIDDHPLAELPCIYDSDSSQHRALIDALEGKNLVIVGPPGTGKSQTITNLIATAMGRGKSVLFISEKKAALEVVSKRLETAGLGPFCLELHSNKSCKKGVLGSLEQRMNQTFFAVKTTRDDLTSLREMRQQLNAYAAQINKPTDIAGVPTVHDLVWKVEKARQSLGPMAAELRSLCWSDALQWRTADVSSRRQVLADLGLHYDQLGHDVSNHPLGRIAIKSFSPIDRFKMEGALREGIAAVTGLSDTFVALHGCDAVHSLSIENCTTWQARLKLIAPCAGVGTDLAQRLQESSTSEIREALALIKTLSTNLVESNQLFPTYGELNAMSLAESPIDDMSIAHLIELAQHFISALSQGEELLPIASIDDLEKLVAWFRPNARHQFLPWSVQRMRSMLARLAALPFSENGDIYELFKLESLDNVDLDSLIAETWRLIHELDRHRSLLALPKEELNLKGMGEVPWEVLKVLHEVLSSAPHHFSLARTLGIDDDTWVEAVKKAKELSQEQQQLSTHFLFDHLPTTEVLEDCLQTAREEAHWWSFICRRIRRAKKLCHRLWRQASPIDISSKQFDLLLLWCQDRDEFLSDPARKKLFEDYLAVGSSTREALETLSWWESVEKRLANINVFWNDRIFYVSSDYGINLFKISENTVRHIEIDQKNICELFQINTALYQHQSELAPYYLALKDLIPLVNKFAPSSIFTVLIEIHQRLMNCRLELNTLGQSVDHSSSWAEFKALLRKQLSEVELVVQRFQSLAPASLTPRQINSAICARQRIAELRACAQAHPLLGSLIVPSSSLDVEQLALLEKALSWWLQVKESGIPSSLAKRVLVQPLELNRVCDEIQQGLCYVQQWNAAVEKLRQLGPFDCVLWGSPGKEIFLNEVHSAKNRFERALTGLDGMDIWIAYNRCKETGMTLDLVDLIQHLESGSLTSAQLSDAFDYVYYHSCIHALYKQFPDLPQNVGYTLENVRQRFSEMDRKIIRLNGTILAADIARRRVPEGRRAARASEQTENILLKHEIAKTCRHLPIRQLMIQAGRAIQALKPCFLMSPLSVAQYLPKSALTFDLLVIDEASQMRLPEAFGAVLRSKQIVVVGDPKQLPPSNFFEEVANDDSDEDEDKGAIEDGVHSILERCLQVFKAPRQLRWHYRSQHQNLIAFSNYHFYDNRLIVLPACHAANARVGVYYNYISDAVYINRSNRNEAEKIVEAVISQLLRDSISSVGVITLNQPQREMIDEIFEQKLREIPALRAIVDQFEACGQKVFIRNLENVQGDERDIIFISTVYGKMPGSAIVRQTFGPINGSSGWRRLNVLFTRARQRIELYSSMQPEDIVISEQSSLGHRILKHYLEFAKNGQLAPVTPIFGEAENPFEESIAALLRHQGYEVHPQLGVQGYWIDMVVCHPDRPGEYLAAIECDGATYHSSRSARDRDRIRQQLLEALGWKGKIFRIWSTDWFAHPIKQADRLLDFLASLRFSKPVDG